MDMNVDPDDLALQPKPILRLDESVVNRIAAGEIIQRPANALKELLENALDAGAKNIRVTVKDGGLKLLQIQDDGCGIRQADLPLLCQRFTTSKLRTFDDLTHMTTFGFRGEALASISHVAHVTVLTMVEGSSCAWRANYSDGALVPPKPGESSDPRSAAGNKGTTLTVEDLFFNVPSRRKSLKNTSEEFGRIVDVVSKYALHNPSVSFICKKAGVASPSISTSSRPSTLDTIGSVYGPSLAKSLVEVPKFDVAELGVQGGEGWVSSAVGAGSAGGGGKKGGFVAFVNHRLVEVPRLKKALEGVYGPILPKGTSPWIYISLMIETENIDVNVHPTKKEVHFLHEDEIVEEVCAAVEKVLRGTNDSRDFTVQSTQGTLTDFVDKGKSRAVEPGPTAEDDPSHSSGEDELQPRPASRSTTQTQLKFSTSGTSIVPRRLKAKENPSFKVRVDPTMRTLDSMFLPVTREEGEAERKRRRTMTDGEVEEVDMDSSEDEDGVEWMKDENGFAASKDRNVSPGGPIRESKSSLTSVNSMRADVQGARHAAVSEILKGHKFVGIVDYDLSLSLLQQSTRLYLIDHAALAEELFYQLGLMQFGEINHIRLDPPPEIEAMLDVALELEEDLPVERRESTKKILMGRILDGREMLAEYFSFGVTEDGKVESLPSLLEGYTPDLCRLPAFLMRVGACVNWGDEQECFETFLRELAFFYLPVPIGPATGLTEEEKRLEARDRAQDLFQLEHVLFPALRRHLVPPKSLLKNKNVTQIADLPDLYKTFERC